MLRRNRAVSHFLPLPSPGESSFHSGTSSEDKARAQRNAPLTARHPHDILPKLDAQDRHSADVCGGTLGGNSVMESFIIFIVVGLVAGWLAGQIMKGGGFG